MNAAGFNHHVTRDTVFAGLDGDLPDPAEEFHVASKLAPSTAYAQLPGLGLLEGSAELRRRTQFAWRRLSDRPRLRLPAPGPLHGDFGALIRRRRSLARFDAAALAAGRLSDLLFAANGRVASAAAGAPARRTSPSAGALYPIDVFIWTLAVEGIPPGLHYYHPAEHALVEMSGASDGLGRAFLNLEPAPSAVLLLAASFRRSRFKYGQRGYRWCLLEAGHCAQNVLLAATALELAACPFGGFYEEPIDRALGLDGVNEGVLYAVLVGLPGPDEKRRDA